VSTIFLIVVIWSIIGAAPLYMIFYAWSDVFQSAYARRSLPMRVVMDMSIVAWVLIISPLFGIGVGISVVVSAIAKGWSK
jgi:hypothetical protein